MPRLARASLALLTGIAGLVALPSPAAAHVNCHFNDTAHTLTISDDAASIIAVVDGRIVVNSYGQNWECTGPDPTVNNTDTIDYTSTGEHADEPMVIASNLAPGFTSEGAAGESEIEVQVSGAMGVTIAAPSKGSANVVAGGTVDGFETHFNVNPGEVADDADILAYEVGDLGVQFVGERYGDRFDARGGAGTGGPLQRPLLATGLEGNDTLYGGSGPTRLQGFTGADKLYAGAGATTLDAGAGLANDTLVGGPNEDLIIPGYGNDNVAPGSNGQDTLRFSASFIRLDLENRGPQNTNEGTDTVGSGFDIVQTGDGPDVLYGTAGSEILRSGGGNDVLVGRGGMDELDGGPGTRDVADYSAAPSAVTVDLAGAFPQATGGGGSDGLVDVEHVIGTPFADALTGDGAPNRLEGRGGADTLAGAGGDDVLLPGSSPEGGADGPDTADGGPGNDRLSYEERTAAVTVRLDGSRNDGADPNRDGISNASEENDLARSIEWATGGAGPDRFQAFGDARNSFIGGAGDDLMDGALNRDQLYGGAGTDTVSYAGRPNGVVVRLDDQRNDGADPDGDGISEYGEENDHLLDVENVIGGNGADRLFGTRTPWGGGLTTANVLTGGPGADFIDALDGTATVDRLNCGTGADTYNADPSDVLNGCEAPAP